MDPDPIDWSPRLKPGESVIWQVRAGPGGDVRRYDIPIVALGAGMVFLGATLADHGTGWPAAVLGAVGAFLAYGQFLIAQSLSTNLTYALTERRALLWHRGRIERFRAVELRLLDGSSIQEHPFSDGRGTITLGRQPRFARWLGPLWPKPAELAYIEDAPTVGRYVRGLITAAELIEELDAAAAQRALEALEE